MKTLDDNYGNSTELNMKVLRSFVKSDTALKDLPFNGSTSDNSFHTQSFHVWLFTCQILNFGSASLCLPRTALSV